MTLSSEHGKTVNVTFGKSVLSKLTRCVNASRKYRLSIDGFNFSFLMCSSTDQAVSSFSIFNVAPFFGKNFKRQAKKKTGKMQHLQELIAKASGTLITPAAAELLLSKEGVHASEGFYHMYRQVE